MAGGMLSEAYQELFEDLKQRIRTARVRVALMVKRELVPLHWQVGQAILQHQAKEGWGTRVIDRFAEDLRQEFPDMTLAAPQSELAQYILKDPYNLGFLTTDDAVERDLHKGLLEHLKNFMLELGAGFAFVGGNYHLKIGGEDFYVDLLFYHA